MVVHSTAKKRKGSMPEKRDRILKAAIQVFAKNGFYATRVSEIAGGRTFRALDQDEMRQAYVTIGELEPELYETISFRPRQSLHWVPMALISTLYLLYHGFFALTSLRARRVADAP